MDEIIKAIKGARAAQVGRIYGSFSNSQELTADEDAIRKGEECDIEKSRSGVYADTAENRKLNRVGQQYGSKKQEDEPNGEQSSKQEENSGSKNSKSIEEHAKNTSDETLKKVSENDKAPEDLRNAAKKELESRGNQSKQSEKEALEGAKLYAKEEFKKRFGHEYDIFDDDSHVLYRMVTERMEELGFWKEEKEKLEPKKNLSLTVYDICSDIDEYEKDDNSNIKKTDISKKIKNAVSKFGSLKVAKSMVKTFYSDDFNNFETTGGASLFDEKEIKDNVLNYFKDYKVQIDDKTKNYLK